MGRRVTERWPILCSAHVGGLNNCLWLPKDMLTAGQVPFGGWPTKGQWFLNETCWQGNCAGWPDNGQHYAKDMLVDGRTLALLAYERIINEGHVGGWPNNGQSFSKDMLLAGRTTASAFRRICWWLAKGYVGGWPNNAQSFPKVM